MAVAVISKTGQKLMPTSERHAARLLKSGKAAIEQYRPIFTIRLMKRKKGKIQPIEYASDTGYQHVGVSIKSKKHEFVHAQYDMLSDEKDRHDKCRKYRRCRRNRLRYRKERFRNRQSKMCKGEVLAPSLQHRVDNQIRLFDSFCKVMPIASATFEMGQFDTQLLQALADGSPLPKGKDYQHGSKYLYQTTRAAVFGRDNYTCQICGRSIKDGAILHTHHIGFWMSYHSNRIGNLLTVCEKCHTAKNHKPGGKLWGIKPKVSNLAGATYMSAVRWRMYYALASAHPEADIHIQYGAKTATVRKTRHIIKTHANDAYCIGQFRPLHRCKEVLFVKKRRNNRILSRFYDAKYIDIRDGKKKSGAQLSCGRTNRRESRHTKKNELVYRGQKCSSGRILIRKRHYMYQPGDIVVCRGRKRIVKGIHNGKNVEFSADGLLPKSVLLKTITINRKIGGWALSLGNKLQVPAPKTINGYKQ